MSRPSPECRSAPISISLLFLNKSIVTPLVKQAVILHGYAFFYMYPSPFSLKISKNEEILFRPNPWSWKLIPWILSMTIVIGISGWGSCVYICTVQLLGFKTKPWLPWNLFNTLIIMGLGVGAGLLILACIILRLSPNIFHSLSEILNLEQKCNLPKNHPN